MRLATLVIPILVICITNIILIVFIVAEKFKYRRKLILIDYYSNKRINTTLRDLITILSCTLFSGKIFFAEIFESVKKIIFSFLLGISWIGLPLSFINRSTAIDGFIAFFSVVNALQGVFIFIHFMVTIQLILNFKTKTNIKNTQKIINIIKNTSSVLTRSSKN
jgi:hypothetical protein